MTTDVPKLPPGFYQDAQGATRWWDGEKWTDQPQVVELVQRHQAQRAETKRAVNESTVRKKTKQGLAALGAIVLLIVAAVVFGGDSEDLKGVVGGLIVLAFYFLPTIIAIKRKHPQTVPIVLIDIFTSWTVIGWFVALIWSVASFRKDT
jgi:hypothetical protein